MPEVDLELSPKSKEARAAADQVSVTRRRATDVALLVAAAAGLGTIAYQSHACGETRGRAEARAECAAIVYPAPISSDDQGGLVREIGLIPNGVGVEIKFKGDSRTAWINRNAIMNAFKAAGGSWRAYPSSWDEPPLLPGADSQEPPPPLLLLAAPRTEATARAVKRAFENIRQPLEVMVDPRVPPQVGDNFILYVASTR